MPTPFTKIIPTNEDYITHATMRKYKNHVEKSYIFLLTKTNCYKLDSLSYQRRWCKNINEIHGVYDDPDNPCQLRLLYLFLISAVN